MGGVISVLRIFSKRGSTSTLSIMSSFVQWEIIKNNHCQLIKRKTTKPMSAEPFNVRNIHSMKSNGFINPRALSITPAKDGKGIVVRRDEVGAQARSPEAGPLVQEDWLQEGPEEGHAEKGLGHPPWTESRGIHAEEEEPSRSCQQEEAHRRLTFCPWLIY